MKKLMIALALAGAAGMALAQSGAAECAGRTRATGPAWCFGEQAIPGSPAYSPSTHYDPPGMPIYRPGVYPWGTVLQGVPYYGGVPYAALYPRTSRDRDGDGIRNRRDRYPDDPRYR